METPTTLNLLTCPLKGTSLIEASAGTGKTYAITGLFLRLVLEKKLSADEILVVTFTEAATEELKDRIRTRLREAIEAFSTGFAKDAFLNDLVQKSKTNSDRLAALRSLKEAVRIFDEARIYTIHGFCRKMLHEYAFESGSLFDTELVTDQADLKREVVEDFWRIHFYKEATLFVNYVIQGKIGPDTFFSLLGKKTISPELKIIPELETIDSAEEERQFKEAFDEACSAWPTAKAEVERILLADKGLKLNQYKKANIPGWIQAMDDFLASGGSNPVLFDTFNKFCSSVLEKSVKKNCSVPEHSFFNLCETLKDCSEELSNVFEKRLLWLKIKLFQYMQKELEQRKKKKNIMFFDDLLLNLYSSLKGEGGRGLSQNMRSIFKAALIDEFQDTDPVQYSIFKSVFGVADSILFLIGDPKQAIYGFRGADVFAYMDAAAHAQTRYTLNENWRSEPDLITAVNAVFESSDLPFIYNEIPFHRVSTPAAKKDHELLRIDEAESTAPMHLWFVDAGKITGSDKPVSKAEARVMIANAVASEISRLLFLSKEKKAVLGERPLREMDIAVLVRQNSEANVIKAALSALNIPSVLYTTDNLFASHEALEVERIMAAVAQPDSEKLLKVSLATDMLGVSGEQINSMIEDEPEWEKWLIKFREYHTLWQEHGFMRMFKSMTLKQDIMPRLMLLEDGERRCTNMSHLSEILHQVSAEKRPGMTGLVKWLSERRNNDAPSDEEHQLRLESDENAVRLVTIHRSKGLEYPLVLCPFSWANSRTRDPKGPFLFHDKSGDMRLTLDLGSDDLKMNRILAEKEMLAENLRLLYVALTRAKNRCYLVLGRFNQSETSAPAYLFHQTVSDDGDNIVNVAGAGFKTLSDKEVFADLEKVRDRAGGTMRLYEMPDIDGMKYSPLYSKEDSLHCRKFGGKIDRQFRISSFSSLISGRHHSAELDDSEVEGGFDEHGSADEVLLDQDELSGIFSFPKGARPGTFMHDILEHLDFVEKDDSHMKELVETKLLEYGFEPEWNETICEMLKNVLAVSLEPDRNDFTFSSIPNRDRLNEPGFYFPLKSLSPEKLKRIFEKLPLAESVSDFSGQLGKLNFLPVKGFMKGYIDMVFQFQNRFYIVDWKSNFLGPNVKNYGPESLDSSMKNEFYVLQYHIYTAALNKYLQLRIPDYSYEKHFGGVFYIFLRGVEPKIGPDYGVYRDRPSGELIEKLCSELIGTDL